MTTSTFEETVRDLFWNQTSSPCGCMGPQDGNPVCPCAMKYVKVVDGHFIQITDLGKVGDPVFSNGGGSRDIILTGYDNGVLAMKAIRTLCDVSLKESKTLIDNTPSVLMEWVYPDEARQIEKLMNDNGVRVELKMSSGIQPE